MKCINHDQETYRNTTKMQGSKYVFCPCVIGSTKFNSAMLDLRASINVMPLSVFNSLHIRPLKTTSVVIQLANCSIVNPARVLEDVLV